MYMYTDDVRMAALYLK